MSRRLSLATGLVALALTSALVVSGCSGDGLDKRFPVSGKVTYNGQPLAKGKINFIPEAANARGGAGDITDGSISNVTTMTPGDGLMPGKYKVAITAMEDVNTDAVAKQYKAMPDPVALAKESRKAKNLIPVKYGNAIDSGLTADVSSSNHDFTFDLKD